MCEICSELTIKTPERRHLHRSGALIVNFECNFYSGVSIVDLEQVNAGSVYTPKVKVALQVCKPIQTDLSKSTQLC